MDYGCLSCVVLSDTFEDSRLKSLYFPIDPFQLIIDSFFNISYIPFFLLIFFTDLVDPHRMCPDLFRDLTVFLHTLTDLFFKTIDLIELSI